jgi:hypothetical protein
LVGRCPVKTNAEMLRCAQHDLWGCAHH